MLFPSLRKYLGRYVQLMVYKYLILFFVLMSPTLGICQFQDGMNPNHRNMTGKFLIPRIIDTLPQSYVLKKASGVTLSKTYIECLSPFTDTLNLAKIPYNIWDTSINRLGDQRSDGLQILVDTTQQVTIKQYDLYDYNESGDTSQYHKGLPCFIYNETANVKWLYTQDSKVIVVQEAMDTNYKWRPIQIWKWSWCGNSYYKLPLKPDYFFFFKIPLFEGTKLARMRLKIYSYDATYYSNEFKGWINYNQFKLPKELMGKKGKPGFNLSFLTSE